MTAPTLPDPRCSCGALRTDPGAPGCAQIHGGLMARLTLSEPRPDDEGRETRPTPRAAGSETTGWENLLDARKGKTICVGCNRELSPTPDANMVWLRWICHDINCTYYGKLQRTESANQYLAACPLTPHPAPLGATDDGLRAAVTRYLAALTAREGAWSEPSCIAEHDRALTGLRAAMDGADWLVSQPDDNPLFDQATAAGPAIDAIRERGEVPACPDCGCSLWPKPVDSARIVWECVEPTCPRGGA